MNSLKEIKKMAKKHPCGHGKIVRYGNEHIIFSVVGNPDQNYGQFRLYGDFEKTFEVAIFDAKTNSFITDFFYGNGDVIEFMSERELINLTNTVFPKGFQFFPY